MSISVVLITKDESSNIEACLDCVKNWADEIVIVDSGSQDDTIQKAKKYTDKIYSESFCNFSGQKNSAMSKAHGDWILLLDADERVGEDLAKEIREICRLNRPSVYRIQRLTYFFGKRLRFSGTQNDCPIRLIPKGGGSYTQPVHEEIVTSLPILKLSHPMLHYSTRDLTHYKIKLNQYIPLEVEHMKQKKIKKSMADLLLRPPAIFIRLYLIKLGIFDGLQGLQYAFLSSYYAFLKYRLYIFS